MIRSIYVYLTVFVVVLLRSQSVLAQPVVTSTTLSSVPASSALGQTVTLTAKVLPTGTPGSVLFMDGTAIVGAGTLDSGGTAPLTTISLPAGTHSLRAVYPGDSGHQPSTSAAL